MNYQFILPFFLNRTKARISYKALTIDNPPPVWATSAAEKIVPKSVTKWVKRHSKLLKGAMYGIGGIMDTLTMGFGIYDVIIGTKHLSGSGTIIDRLQKQADLQDLSLLG